MAPNGVAMPLLLGGTAAQQEAYLPRFADMTPPPFSAALTEPRVLFNPYKLETTAVLREGAYVLNGRKTIVPFADRRGAVPCLCGGRRPLRRPSSCPRTRLA